MNLYFSFCLNLIRLHSALYILSIGTSEETGRCRTGGEPKGRASLTHDGGTVSGGGLMNCDWRLAVVLGAELSGSYGRKQQFTFS